MMANSFNYLAIAASIAMDAFSVSICIGLCHDNLRSRQAMILAGSFGFFQFVMPLIGAEIAEHISGFFASWTPWVASGLIVWVAFNMIKEAYTGNDKNDSCMSITLRNVTILAFATSLDALIVGFSIKSSGGSAWGLAVSAGIITFFLSFFGALAGRKLGEKVGRYAEYFGGGVLFLIALSIILEKA